MKPQVYLFCFLVLIWNDVSEPYTTISIKSKRLSLLMFNRHSETKDERKTWNPLRLAVLRLGLTEPMMTSLFNYGNYSKGVFKCAYCGNELFDGSAKYDSGSGWPSFWRTHSADALLYRLEADGRLECKCKRCNSHLGHVFLDGPTPRSVDSALLQDSPASDPRGRSGMYLPRFCINGAAMTFSKTDMSKNQ